MLVSFVLSFFPRDVLDEILNLIGSLRVFLPTLYHTGVCLYNNYISSRSHPRHLVGKRTAQKDTIIDITSDNQVNSNFPNRWSPASLTFNNYFYLFLYIYITRITINNNAPHLKSPKNQNRRAALGRPAIKITGGLQLVCGRPTLAHSSALFPQTLSCLVCVEDS